MKELDANHRPDNTEVTMQSVKDFLGRPTLLSVTQWTTAQVQGTNLLTQSAMHPLVDIVNFPHYVDKVHGFAFIRATACLRIVVNAQPFQAGRLLLSFLPGDQSIFSDVNCYNYIRQHATRISSKTMLPNVEIDARDSGCLMKMPYIAPTHWFSLNTDYHGLDAGVFRLDVLSQAATGSSGQDTISIAAYIHYEDIQLMGPTYTQGDIIRGIKKWSAKLSKEAENVIGMPVSKGLRLASKTAASLGNHIPELKEFTEPTAWGLDVLAKGAKSIGWSKPQNDQSGNLVGQVYHKFGPNATGVNEYAVMGIQHDNMLRISDNHSIHQYDEMTWAFLKKQWCYIRNFSWQDTNVIDTSLYTLDISPTQLCDIFNTGAVNGHTFTFSVGPPIYYFANFFLYWRGSIEYRLRVVKTDFHTGRLMIIVNYDIGGASGPTNAQSTYNLREVIDLKEGNEFCFTLPYFSDKPYQRVNEAIGQIDVRVLNALRSPETTSSAVEVLVYVRGGDDFEFQVPRMLATSSTSTIEPCTPNLSFSAPTTFGYEVIQSGYDRVEQGGIGSASIPNDTINYSEYCIGEHFTSIKQFLNRDSLVKFVAAQPGTSSNTFQVNPWFYPTQIQDGTSGLRVSGLAGYDAFTYLAGMYAFARGKPRLTIRSGNSAAASGTAFVTTLLPKPRDSSPTNTFIGGNTTCNGEDTSALGSSAISPFSAVHLGNTNVGMVGLTIPYYNNYDCHFLWPQTSTVTSVHATQPTNIVNVFDYQTLGTYGVWRSFSDDSQLSYFVGCPPLLTNYA